MNIEELREYCLSFKGTTEGMPFGDETLVIKVSEKMFALMGLNNNPPRINLKCDPQMAVELREKHPSVIPGYHMNKQHWNTVIVDGSVNNDTIREWIKISYYLVLKSLPKWKQKELE